MYTQLTHVCTYIYIYTHMYHHHHHHHGPVLPGHRREPAREIGRRERLDLDRADTLRPPLIAFLVPVHFLPIDIQSYGILY